MSTTGGPLGAVTVEADTRRFPRGLFAAYSGRGLALHGGLLPATGTLRSQFDAALGIPEVQRVLRLVPSIGLDSPKPFTGIVDSAVQGACPVVRVDADDERSVAFAVRLVQAFLTRFRPPDSDF